MARASKDDAFLKQARARWQLAEEAEKKQRDREREDLQFYAGEQWPADLLETRKGITLGSGSNQQTVPARPSLVVNKTIEPVRQVLNQERQADLGFELIPADDFGEVTGPIDHTEIDLREGLVRRIQRDSEAADARTWGFMRAAIAGRGYWVVMTRYLPGKRADQEIYLERIYNQASVRLDPSREQPDGSDAEWGFYGTDMLWLAFKAEYPQAKVSQITSDADWNAFLRDDSPLKGWFTGEGEKRAVRVMNYYYTERETKELHHLSNGAAVYAEELERLPPGVTVVEDESGAPLTHYETKKSIKWAKIVGNEVLDRTDWPGRWIPIIQVLGEELQPYDNERRAQGIVRPMMDSCRGNNYLISKFVERVGLTPIPPWMMAGGQDEGYEDEYNAANTRTIGRLHYNQKDQFNQPAPPPFRTDVRAEVTDIAQGVQIFSQAITSTSVSPETGLGHTDPTVKSGKLANALIEQAERGTSNFMDNLVRSMRHEARVINDLLYPIYGRPGRLARILNGQGEIEALLVGQPFVLVGDGKNKRPTAVPANTPLPPQAKVYKLTPDADFNVAWKISKNIDTRRQQIVAFLSELIGADPAQMMIIGDKLWKYLDVPDHTEIEERYKVMLAPPIQKLLAGDVPLPPEAQAQIAALEQQLAEVVPLADKNKADLEKTRMQELAEIERARMEIESREKIAAAQNQVKLTDIEAKIDLAVTQAMIKWQTDAHTMQMEAAHAKEMAAIQAQAKAASAEQAHGHALEQGAQSHHAALGQGEQQHQQSLVEAEQANQAAIEQGQLAHEQALEQQAAAPTATP